MPQVQVLPGVPTFGTELAKVLSTAASDVGSGVAKGYQKKKFGERVGQLGENPTFQQLLELSANAPESAQTLIAQYMKGQAQNPSMLKFQATQAKEQQKQQDAQQSLLEQRQIVRKGYTGPMKGVAALFSPEVRRNRAKFEELNLPIRGAITKLIERGAINQKQWENINEMLPQLGERRSTIEGKLDGLERMIGTTPEYQVALAQMEEATPSRPSERREKMASNRNRKTDTSQTQGEKVVDMEMAQKFLKAAGGDANQARELARKAGYTF